jgi:hypothetical protein
MDIEILGQQMEINITEEDNGTKIISVLPWPDSRDAFLRAASVIDVDSLKILWSKHYFGISHRTQMFMVLYRTFVATYKSKSTIDHELTLQTLYCDMILRLGTILEDFAGMCSACREFSLHGTCIAEYFLAYSDPMAFYNSINVGGRRQIKQMFRLVESKGNLDRIFTDLTDNEKELLWKAINMTTETIQEFINDISKTICREVATSVTYYDLYNKLKHGFAPIYPFTLPIPYELMNVPNDVGNEEVLKHYIMSGITIMHDKVAGQRTQEEAEKFANHKLATPAITFDPVTMEAADSMRDIIEKIDYLYKHLVNVYLSYSQGSKRISFKVRQGALTENEENEILSIIENESRYI